MKMYPLLPDAEHKLVDFILNVRSDVEDPHEALLFRFPDRPDFVQFVLDAVNALAKSDPSLFLAIHGPEMGDRTLRKWLRGVVKSFDSGSGERRVNLVQFRADFAAVLAKHGVGVSFGVRSVLSQFPDVEQVVVYENWEGGRRHVLTEGASVTAADLVG